MADFNCPICGKALARKARKDESGYFWGCTGFRDGCKFVAADWQDEPFIHNCTECGEPLRVRTSKKTGNSYIACMNKERHKSGDALFFREDGTLKDDDSRPKAKGVFTCPECGEEIKYFQHKSGARAGKMGFGCFASDKHASGRALFWEDNNGRPVM